MAEGTTYSVGDLDWSAVHTETATGVTSYSHSIASPEPWVQLILTITDQEGTNTDVDLQVNGTTSGYNYYDRSATRTTGLDRWPDVVTMTNGGATSRERVIIGTVKGTPGAMNHIGGGDVVKFWYGNVSASPPISEFTLLRGGDAMDVQIKVLTAPDPT